MTSTLTALCGAMILEAGKLRSRAALLMRGGGVEGIVEDTALPEGAEAVRLDGGLLVPGFVDLQVNGGGGVMLGDAPDAETLRVMAAAHARIGATTILPTLITDTPEKVAAAISAVETAVAEGVPGIAGLHLEGPHLAPGRKGAHDLNLIRPMSAADLETLLDAAARLPLLKVTLAPESVELSQISALQVAGVLVSLGHTDAGYETCCKAAEAGAACVTHLFNAQSQIAGREPGVVGAALSLGTLSAGLIADGVHVHPANMALALRAKTGPGKIFLVSDAMATAGADIASFTLNGREIRRDGNRLTLADGTLAGAHLELATAVRNLVELCAVPLEAALMMASEVPAVLAGLSGAGRLVAGAQADVLHLSDGLELQQVWQQGRALL